MAFHPIPSTCTTQEPFTIPTHIFALYLTIMSISWWFCAGIGARYLYRRWHRRHKTTSIGRLLDYLVFVVAVIDALYHAWDPVLGIDCQATPYMTLLDQDPSRLFMTRTVIYNIVQEGFALLSIWWHATIAWCMYGWLVLKFPASRLRQTRICWLIAAAAAVTGFRAFLFYHYRTNLLGLYLSNILFLLVLVPATLALIIRWYCLTSWTLRLKDARMQAEEAAQLRLEEELRQKNDDEEAAAAAAASFDVEAGRGWDRDGRGRLLRSPSVRPRGKPKGARHFRWLIRSLMRICAIIVVLWIARVVVETYIWAFYYTYGRAPPPVVFYWRVVVTRLVGVFDALILGDIFSCFSHYRSPSPSGAAAAASGSAGTAAAAGSASAASANGGSNGMLAVQGTGRGMGASDRSSAPSAAVSSSPTKPDAAPRVKLTDVVGGQARDLGHASIFACTWNMGGVEREQVEVHGEAMIRFWVPRGYDIYVIGVQECLCLPELRAALHRFLGGPNAYQLYGSSIGDKTILHGEIALTVLAHADEVASGAFHLHKFSGNSVATGVDLGPMGRVANKGMVGLSVRYHDVSIALITCHMASDQHGKSRLVMRNRDARRSLKELALQWDSDFDVHHTHHHTILLGDTNYRMDAQPDEIAALIADSARLMQAVAEAKAKAAAGSSSGSGSGSGSSSSSHNVSWRRQCYAQMFALHSPEGPAAPRPTSVYRARSLPASTSAWAASVARRAHAALLAAKQAAPDDADKDGDLDNVPAPPLAALRSQLPPGDGGGGSGGGPPSLAGLPSSFSSLGEPAPGTWGPDAASELMEGADPLVFPLSAGHTSSFSTSGGSLGEDDIATAEALSGLGRSTSLWIDGDRVLNPAAAAAAPPGYEHGWMWVPMRDELHLCMRNHRVFTGFHEGTICFPPSYRWFRVPTPDGVGDLAADYVDAQRLLDMVYTTWVKRKGSVAARAINRIRSLSRGASAVSAGPPHPTGAGPTPSSAIPTTDLEAADQGEGDGGDGQGGSGAHPDGSPVPPTQPLLGKLWSRRTPSYTDRIVFFSLPGAEGRLSSLAYEMADFIGASDHRPVVSALDLVVDRTVTRGFRVAHPVPPSLRGADAARFTITLSRPMLHLRPNAQGFSFLREPEEVVVSFPLPAEDPWAAERKASTLEQALPGPLGKKQSSLDAAQAGAMSEREQHLRWSGFPIVHSVVASKRFSQHLLIKILDARGRDLGQGIVQVLPSPASPSAAAAAAAAKGRETFYPVVERSARAGGGKTEGEGDDEEEEGEETMDLEAGVGSGDPSLSVRRVRLPLTSGSKLKGWLHLDVHVGLEPWSS